MTDFESKLGFKEAPDFEQLAKVHLIPQGIEVPAPEIVFGINGIPLLTKKSLSLLIAKAKAGKTTVAAWIISQSILTNTRVLWIDTEQGLYYASRTQHWILSIAGLTSSECLEFYDLKIHAPNVRIEIIEYLISSKRFDLIVIDGIRDLVFDINSPEEATNTATNLMKWAEVYDCHLLNILHQNKGNEHARGHLGSELVNKAELVLKVSQDDEKQIIVEPEFCRGEPFDAFAINRDETGKPYLVDGFVLKSGKSESKSKILLPNEIHESTHLEILQRIFKNQPEKKYKEFWQSIQNEINTIYGWHVANAKAENYVQYYVDKGIILIKGKTPQTKYFINPDLLN
jgi:hypothetical protein